MLMSLSLFAAAFGTVTRYPDGVSSYGIPIPANDYMTTGVYYFVSSSDVKLGNDANNGTNTDWPYKTIDKAVNQCTSGQGDVIFIMPGYKSTIVTSDLTLDVAGVRIVGLGKGNARPQLTIGTTGTGTDIPVSGENITLENIIFIPGIDGLDMVLDVKEAANDLTIRNCDFRGTSAIQIDNAITVTNNVDRLSIVGNKVRQTTLGGESFIKLGLTAAPGSEMEDIYIGYNDIVGDYSTANIANESATMNDCLIEYNNIENLNASDTCITINQQTDGTVRYNTLRIATDAKDSWISGGGTSVNINVQLYENWGVNSDGETGMKIGIKSTVD